MYRRPCLKLGSAAASGFLLVLGLAVVVSPATARLEAPTGSYRAQMENYVGCPVTGKVTAQPGLTMTAHDLAFTLTGTASSCQSSDSSIKSANLAAAGTANASCTGGDGLGTFTVAWNNGNKSSGTITASFRPPFAYGTVKVTDGEFDGAHGWAGALGMTSDPSACLSSGGLTELTFDGLAGLRGGE